MPAAAAAPAAGAAPPPAPAAPSGAPAKAAPAPKRKAPEIDDTANALELRRLFANGELGKATVPSLKAFVRHARVPGGLGGAKGHLVERIIAFLTAPSTAA